MTDAPIPPQKPQAPVPPVPKTPVAGNLNLPPKPPQPTIPLAKMPADISKIKVVKTTDVNAFKKDLVREKKEKPSLKEIINSFYSKNENLKNFIKKIKETWENIQASIKEKINKKKKETPESEALKDKLDIKSEPALPTPAKINIDQSGPTLPITQATPQNSAIQQSPFKENSGINMTPIFNPLSNTSEKLPVTEIEKVPEKKKSVGSFFKSLFHKKEDSTEKAEIIAPTTVLSQNVGNGGISKEDQKKLLKARNKIPFYILALKYLSIISTIVAMSAFIALKADISEENEYLSIIGHENRGAKQLSLKETMERIQKESNQTSSDIKEIKRKLDQQLFYVNRDTINEIKKDLVVWFDKIGESGLEYGLLDSAQRMANYFNSSSYSDRKGVLSGNVIKVANASVSKESASFAISSSNLFGKIFYLNTEFINMMNSYPFFKGASMKSFSRSTLSNGDDSMNFSLSMKIQNPDEVDPADENFILYEQWLKDQRKKK